MIKYIFTQPVAPHVSAVYTITRMDTTTHRIPKSASPPQRSFLQGAVNQIQMKLTPTRVSGPRNSTSQSGNTAQDVNWKNTKTKTSANDPSPSKTSTSRNLQKLRLLAQQGAKEGNIVKEYSNAMLGIYNSNDICDKDSHYQKIIDDYITTGKVYIDASILPNSNYTTLDIITAIGSPKAVQYLLDLKADPNGKSTIGSPLHQTIERGYGRSLSLATLKDMDALIAAGANLEAKNFAGLSPLERVLQRMLQDPTLTSNYSLALRLNKLIIPGKCHVEIDADIEKAKQRGNHTPQQWELFEHIYTCVKNEEKIPLYTAIVNGETTLIKGHF